MDGHGQATGERRREGAPATGRKTRRELLEREDWEKKLGPGRKKSELMKAVKEAAETKDLAAVGPLLRLREEYFCKDTELSDAVLDAIGGMGEGAVDALAEEYRKGGAAVLDAVLFSIDALERNRVDCSRIIHIPILAIEGQTSEADDAYSTLVIMGKKAVEPVKRAMGNAVSTRNYFAEEKFEEVLVELGVKDNEIEKIRGEARVDSVLEGLGGQQKAVLRLLGRRDAKQIVLGDSEVVNALPDRQAWITVNEPALAREALVMALEKAGKKRGALENVLRNAAGFRINELGAEQFRIYADEILDAVAQYAKGSAPGDDAEMREVLSRIRHGGDVKLRFVRRETSDISLGDKCGDCTAKGSVNFERSISWLANPAYQILKIYSHGKFIGRMNLALAAVGGKPAIIVDATEFAPHAEHEGDLKKDAVDAFREAVDFVRGIAKKEGMGLYALRASNCEHVEELYMGDFGRRAEYANLPRKHHVQMIFPIKEVKGILEKVGYSGGVTLFYQTMSYSTERKGIYLNPLERARNARLEREVLNPAQIADGGIAAAMRERDFAAASRLILANPGYAEKVRGIFGISQEYGISPRLLEGRMGEIYPESGLLAGTKSVGFVCDGLIVIET